MCDGLKKEWHLRFGRINVSYLISDPYIRVLNQNVYHYVHQTTSIFLIFFPI